MPLKPLPVKVPIEIDKRLSDLARKTHRTKAFYIREALINYLEEMEDTYLALQILEKPGRIYTMEEVEKELGLGD